jgi:hypothetical protein
MLSFGNDSSLFCDFRKALLKSFPYSYLNSIFVSHSGRHSCPETPGPPRPFPGPARRGFLYQIIDYKPRPGLADFRGSPPAWAVGHK